MNQDQINQLKQAFELSPDNQVLQLLYFNALTEASKWPEAEEIIKIIVQNNPNNHEYLIEYCKLLCHLNKVSQGTERVLDGRNLERDHPGILPAQAGGPRRYAGLGP